MSKKEHIVNYLLLIFFVATSGVPNFKSSSLYIPLFIFLLITFIKRSKKFDRQFNTLILTLLLISIFQFLNFDHFSFANLLGVFLPIFNAYLILKILSISFTYYYVKVMKIIAVISLLFYLPSIVFPVTIDVLNSFSEILKFIDFSDSSIDTKTIIIFNIRKISEFRNPGPFWEPGLYCGYLILAFIFNTYNESINKKSTNLIFIIAILTTLSTTGYIAFFTFLFFYYYNTIKNGLLKFTGILFLILLAYYSFVNFDFLGKKIQNQLEEVNRTTDVNRGNKDTQRFLNILRDIQDFKNHELFGRGSLPINRYSYDPENQIRTVGLTDILVRNGIVFFVILFLMIFSSLQSFTIYYNSVGNIHALGIFITVIISLFSQIYFQYQLYWILPFLSMVYNKNKLKLK